MIKIVNGFLEILRREHDVRQVYLFGSFAKGMAKDYSDVDLAIVLGSLDLSEESPFNEAFKVFHEAQKYNSLLEVVCFAQEEFDKDGEKRSFSSQLKEQSCRGADSLEETIDRQVLVRGMVVFVGVSIRN